MSEPPHENIDVTNPLAATNTVGDRQYPPQSMQNQESRGASDFVDGSGHIFSMYLEMASEEDKKMAENWKDDADGILIFTGLFSAAVASLISVSIQDLQQNPQDTSNFYLSNIYQATINPNESSSLPTSPPPFTPPNFAIWVNALWFLSLVISITCALLATLLQQWARRYLKVTHSRYSPHKRARIRTFFSEGIDKFLLPWAVEALPTMLHLSLFLFFAGLAVFLWNVNLTIFKLVLSWIGLCISLYGCITFIPVFCHDSPYHTPLSLPVWHLITGIPFLTFRVLETISLSSDWFSYETYERFERLAERYGHLLVQGMQKTAEESALRSSSEIDARAFMWTFDCLDEDHELERFFSGLPGFRSSKVVEDPLPWLTSDQEGKLLNAVIGLLDRTSSDLLPEPVKVRRNVICAKAIGPVNNPLAMLRVLRRIVSEDQYGPVQTSEIARLVKGWDNGKDEETTIIRAIASSVIVRAQRRDDLWYAMASDEMGVSESILRNHATHGNNLSLSILVHVIRQQFSHVLDQHWPWSEFWKVLKTTSEFDVRNTSPELQHEFCALWNEVVRFEDWKIRRYILRPIHNTYLMLHPHTDSTQTQIPVFTNDDDDAALLQLSMYPLCSTPGHHPDSMSISHDAYPYTAISDTVLHDTAVPVPVSLDTTPNVPSPSAPAPENTVDVPLLNDGVSAPVSSHPAHPPAAESLSVPVILPDPQAATGAALRDVDTYPRTILSGSLTSAASVPPTGDLSLQGNTDLLVYSDTEISSPAPEPDLENILKTESHSSIIATTTPVTSPPSSAPGMVSATHDKGSSKASPLGHKDALDLPPVDRASGENTVTIADPLPSLLPSATDVAFEGPSQQEFDAENTGGSPHFA